VLAVLGILGVLPMRASTAATSYADTDVAWWVPLVVLGLVTAALAYVAGIAAGRRLGSRLASFVALLEVVSSVFWAWLLLHELPAATQLLGGLLILAGVVAVKLGERSVVTREPAHS
jgi:drug/metabolite transporter (DMT)-like permease